MKGTEGTRRTGVRSPHAANPVGTALAIVGVVHGVGCGPDRPPPAECRDPYVAPVDPACGNGRVEQHEQCDGDALGGATCTMFAYLGGTLACRDACFFDYSACTVCPRDLSRLPRGSCRRNIPYRPGTRRWGCSAACRSSSAVRPRSHCSHSPQQRAAEEADNSRRDPRGTVARRSRWWAVRRGPSDRTLHRAGRTRVADTRRTDRREASWSLRKTGWCRMSRKSTWSSQLAWSKNRRTSMSPRPSHHRSCSRSHRQDSRRQARRS